MKIERRCTCGAVLRATVPPRRRDQCLAHWYAQHSGEGHGDAAPARTDAEAARQAEARRWEQFAEYDGT
jgi:hypothetical protein